jgi:hypothetical protein
VVAKGAQRRLEIPSVGDREEFERLGVGANHQNHRLKFIAEKLADKKNSVFSSAALKIVTRQVLLPLWVLGIARFGLALDPAKAVTQYRVDVWHLGDGMPQESVRALT